MLNKTMTLAVVAAVVFALVPAAQAALVDNLRSYWSFESSLVDQAHGLAGSGSTVADDGSFGGTNGGYDTGKFGSALDTNTTAATGVNGTGYATITASADTKLSGAADLSVSVWVQWNGASSSHAWEAVYSHGDANMEYRLARHNGSTTNVACRVNNADIPDGSSNNAFDGSWHHVAIAYDNDGGANNFSIWLDGTKKMATQNAGTFGTQDDNFRIGGNAQPSAGDRLWGGQIDDLAVWDRVITDAEVAEIYNSGDGKEVASLIPEPATMMLIALGGLGVLVRRRRRA